MHKKSGYKQTPYGSRKGYSRGTGGNRTSTGLRVDEVGVVMAANRRVDPDYINQPPDDYTGMIQEKYPLGGRGER